MLVEILFLHVIIIRIRIIVFFFIKYFSRRCCLPTKFGLFLICPLFLFQFEVLKKRFDKDLASQSNDLIVIIMVRVRVMNKYTL